MKKILFLFLTLISGLLFAQGGGQTAEFNGSNSYLTPGNEFKYTSDFTVEFWAYHDDWLPSSDQALLSCFQNNGGYYLKLKASSNTLRLQMGVGSSSSYVDLAASNLTSGWHHFAITYENNTMQLVIDSEEDFVLTVPNTTTGISYHPDNNYIFGGEAGSGTTPSGEYFEGYLDEIRIWTKHLSYDQLTNHRHETIDASIEYISDLQAYYRFDNATGWLTDYSETINGSNTVDYELSPFNCSNTTSSMPVGAYPSGYIYGPRALWRAVGTSWSSNSKGLFLQTSTALAVNKFFAVSSIAGTGSVTTDLPVGVLKRAKKIWFMDDYAGTDLSMKFDCDDFSAWNELYTEGNTAGNFKLLKRAGTSGNFQVVSIATSINTNDHTITFNNISVSELGDGFYTLGVGSNEASVLTSTISNISSVSASGGGNVISDGGSTVTAKGVCWATSTNPTISNFHTTDGSGTGSYNSLISGLSPNTTYYVRAYATNSQGTVYGDQVSFSTTSDYTWIGSVSTNWNIPGNWNSNSVPTIGTDVIIAPSSRNPVILDGVGANCKNLTIQSGASLTINFGGSLITTGSVSGSGTVTVKLDLSEGNDWHFISPPNANSTSTLFAGYYLDEWNEQFAEWQQITEPGVDLGVLKGYSLFDVPAKKTFNFVGLPNTGSKSRTITYHVSNASNEGINLLGNPYPSAIDWFQINGYGSVYLWNGNSYISWNNSSGGDENARYIAPMQGFIVFTTVYNTFTITNEARTHTGASSFYKAGSAKMTNGLVLSTNKNDKLYIRFFENAYSSFDYQLDALKLLVAGDGLSQIYSIYDSTRYSIDARQETNLIQLGYFNEVSGHYSIELDEIDGIAKAELEDTKTNKIHDLANGAYEFDWVVGDSEERFKLHLKATGVNELEQKLAQVYGSKGQIYIRTDAYNQFDQFELYDITGRLIINQSLTKESLQKINAPELRGAYIIRLIGNINKESHVIIL